ncbi:PaaI family thioesterase [Streptomyces sp. NPDC005708]|uniref:PaaI family thioesterase n=1 Tax=unclassified Streptomyces TaxID=2593676 RepID=UPI0033E5F474
MSGWNGHAAGTAGLRDQPWFRCFGCSSHHPQGLRLDPRRTAPDEVACTVVFGPDLCSYPGITHGGIVTTAVDDVMANLILIERGVLVFSATLRTRFLQPVATGRPYRIIARITRSWEGGYRTEAEVVTPEGAQALVAEATYAHVRPEHLGDLMAVGGEAAARLRPHLAPSDRIGAESDSTATCAMDDTERTQP